MGRLKTYVLTIFFCLAGTQPMLAFEEDPLNMFANCAGRLSALMEFQWLLGDAEADNTQRQRAAVLELLTAAMQPGQEQEALALRIAAKQAHAVLLTRATFNDDENDAAWAAALAAQQQNACTGFLLG